MGYNYLLELTKTGVLPNKNYVDPIDGITHKDKTLIHFTLPQQFGL